MKLTVSESLEVFGLSDLKNQDKSSLKKVYYELAARFHPDRGGKTEDFIRIREAYSILKKVLSDPNFDPEKEAGFKNEQSKEYSNYKNNTFDELKTKYAQLFEELNAYKQAFSKASENVAVYEDVFNSQIRVINSTQNAVNEIVKVYNKSREELNCWLEENLSKIEKMHKRKWWEYAVPVKKISKFQYVEYYNEFVKTYNTKIAELERDFLEKTLQNYQSSFKDMMNLMKF